MKFVENYAKIGVSDQLGLLCKDTSIKVCPLSLLANILCVTQHIVVTPKSAVKYSRQNRWTFSLNDKYSGLYESTIAITKIFDAIQHFSSQTWHQGRSVSITARQPFVYKCMFFMFFFVSVQDDPKSLPQGCLKECLKRYPSGRGRVLELLIGGEFLSYPSLIGQLKTSFKHPEGYVSVLGFRLFTCRLYDLAIHVCLKSVGR